MTNDGGVNGGRVKHLESRWWQQKASALARMQIPMEKVETNQHPLLHEGWLLISSRLGRLEAHTPSWKARHGSRPLSQGASTPFNTYNARVLQRSSKIQKKEQAWSMRPKLLPKKTLATFLESAITCGWCGRVRTKILGGRWYQAVTRNILAWGPYVFVGWKSADQTPLPRTRNISLGPSTPVAETRARWQPLDPPDLFRISPLFAVAK